MQTATGPRQSASHMRLQTGAPIPRRAEHAVVVLAAVIGIGAVYSRRVHLGITTNPDGRWVSQQARNLLMQLDDEAVRPRFLIRDRDSKFTREFDEVFRSEGVRVIKAPVRAPKARAHAERWIGSVRRECLDRLLIVGRSHLQHVLANYTRQYNEHRPHRAPWGSGHRSASGRPGGERAMADVIDLDRVRRGDLLGGLIHEYQLAA